MLLPLHKRTQVFKVRILKVKMILALFASVETGSSHPLAEAIVSHAEAAKVFIPVAFNASATAGKAVHATVAERALAIGSPVYAADEALIHPHNRRKLRRCKMRVRPSLFFSMSKTVKCLD
ncbi:hypothetical protein [Psychrobacter sp. YP14]|uniref:hypothetical protein n=1 Tax=Psychrobacter sp. YP14 TaxID=2203895 RepID=UPI0029E800DF|nr:hypothetical protein [Psychrobacter sp. YP14]